MPTIERCTPPFPQRSSAQGIIVGVVGIVLHVGAARTRRTADRGNSPVVLYPLLLHSNNTKVPRSLLPTRYTLRRTGTTRADPCLVLLPSFYHIPGPVSSAPRHFRRADARLPGRPHPGHAAQPGDEAIPTFALGISTLAMTLGPWRRTTLSWRGTSSSSLMAKNGRRGRLCGFDVGGTGVCQWAWGSSPGCQGRPSASASRRKPSRLPTIWTPRNRPFSRRTDR
jgi:hypothetical protein